MSGHDHRHSGRFWLVALCVSVAIYVVAGLIVWTALSGAAEMTGDGAAWARTIQVHVPGPPGAPLSITRGPCPNLAEAAGCLVGSSIYVQRWGGSVFVLEHELGHAFDDRALTDDERAWFVSNFGFPSGTPWENPGRWTDGDPFCQRTACPNERFADAYADCALGLYAGHSYSRAGDPVSRTLATSGRVVIRKAITQGDWHPSDAQRLTICSAIRAVISTTNV